MARILFVADSTCDVPAEWLRRFDIRIVPTYVQFGQESLADDGIELTRPDFYRRLSTSSVHPTTSAPPLGKTVEVFRQALKDADHVVALTAPSNLSAIYNIFRLAAEQHDPDRVTLIDGRMVSMGLGWQVIIGAEMAQAGASPAEIKAALVAVQPHTDVWAALDTMEYLRRSGRVSWATAVVGDLFRIKPIIRLHDGVVSSVARARTSKRTFMSLVDLAHKVAPFDRLAILHTQNLNGAQKLAEVLTDIRPAGDMSFAIVEATPVLGVHVGPNGLGLGVVRKR